MKRQWLAVLLILLISVGFLYSFSQIFVDNNAITGKTIENSEISEFADFSSEMIIIPVKVHFIRDDSGYYTSFRSQENVFALFNEVNRIWSKANIYFSVEEIAITEVSFNAIPNTINGDSKELYQHKNFDKEKINVFFVQSLNGINGLALADINSILVSDFTTVNDFRATAHELGHLLGLGHVAPENRLLARGKNGEFFTEDEIIIARQSAIKFLSNSDK